MEKCLTLAQRGRNGLFKINDDDDDDDDVKCEPLLVQSGTKIVLSLDVCCVINVFIY